MSHHWPGKVGVMFLESLTKKHAQDTRPEALPKIGTLTIMKYPCFVSAVCVTWHASSVFLLSFRVKNTWQKTRTK